MELTEEESKPALLYYGFNKHGHMSGTSGMIQAPYCQYGKIPTDFEKLGILT